MDPGAPPAPLPSAPLEPVQSGQLDPITGQPQVVDPNAQNTQIAGIDPNASQVQQSAPPPQSGESISREGMAGTWTVPSDNSECRIILAFTKWSGGYRAATRRCNTPELAAVSAWDVRDNRVVLVDSNGNNVASLYSSGGERYDGTTNSGKPIQFTR
ncbi:MAG: protease inhibitor Inh/omp19 family protein [Rhizobiaceae bacterium]